MASRRWSWGFADTRRPRWLTSIDMAKFLIDLGLRPRWDARHQHVSHTPYPIRQPSDHSWRPGLPALDGSRLGAPIDLGPWQAQTRVGPPEGVIHLAEPQRLTPPGFGLAYRIDSTPACRHVLPKVPLQARAKRGRDRPAWLGQSLIDRLLRAEHHVVLDPKEAATPVRLHDLGIEYVRQGPPTRLGRRTGGLPTRGATPRAIRGDSRCEVRPPSLGHKERGTVRRQNWRDLRPQGLGPLQRALTDVHGQDERADRVQRHPSPVWRARPALDGLGLRDVSGCDGAEPGEECAPLPRFDRDLLQARAGAGFAVFGCFDQPAQGGVRIDRKDARHRADATAFGPSGDRPPRLVRIALLSRKRRAQGLREIAAAAQTREVSPAASRGVAVGAEMPAADPAVMRTGSLRANVGGGSDLAATGSGHDHAGRGGASLFPAFLVQVLQTKEFGNLLIRRRLPKSYATFCVSWLLPTH
jgi:hypothetical protein